jgi:hypothetical protein
VVGFLAMTAVRTTGLLPPPALQAAGVAPTLLVTAALFALGVGVRVGELLRTGRRGVLLGAVSTALVAAAGLGAVNVIAGACGRRRRSPDGSNERVPPAFRPDTLTSVNFCETRE